MFPDQFSFQQVTPAFSGRFSLSRTCERRHRTKFFTRPKRRRPCYDAGCSVAQVKSSLFSPEESPELAEWPNSPFQMNDVVNSKYTIRGVLGQGSNGITYEAEMSDGKKSSLVALKALSFKAMSNWKALELFKREARTLRTLSFPAIPSYIDSFEVDSSSDRVYVLVQRKAPGVSLQKLLNEGYRFSTEQVESIFRQLLEVLQYLSSLNPPVLHRDVKPSNVVLNMDSKDEFDVSLVDFGAVNSGVASTGATGGGLGSTMIGTFGYMAPEQFAGTSDVRSDLYAAAATILNVVTRRAPSSLPQRRLKIDVESVVPERERLKLGNVYTVMLKLLEPAPEDRYDSSSKALEALLSLEENDVMVRTDNRHSEMLRTMVGSLTVEEALSLDRAFSKIGTSEDNGRNGPIQKITGWAERKLRRRKPAGSRVVLDRDRCNRLLRVTIPAKGLSSDALSKGLFTFAWTGFVAFWTAGVLTGGAPIVMSLFSIPFWAAGAKLAKSTLDEVTGLATLVASFGGGEKEVFYFGLTSKSAIGRSIIVEGDSRDLTHASVEVQMYVNGHPVTELVLYEGTRRHIFGLGLEQVEQEWLRDEMNDFLNRKSRS